jgi:hypothetical protein
VAIFASPISGPVLRTVAETSVCSAAESFDVYHLECVPSRSGVSERTLTACSGSGYIRSPAVKARQISASRGHIDRKQHGVISIGSSSRGCCRRCRDRGDGRFDRILRQGRTEGARDLDNHDHHHDADQYICAGGTAGTDGEEHQPHRGEPVHAAGLCASGTDSTSRGSPQ